MTPSALLHALIAPVTIGDEPASGVRLTRISDELGLRLTFARDDGARLHVEVTLLSHARRFALKTRLFAISYRGFDASLGLNLCNVIAERVRDNEVEALTAYRSQRVEATERVRRVKVARALEPMGDHEEPFFGLSPYVGCLIGCGFCYAHEKIAPMRALEGLPEVAWGSYVDARENLADVLRDELTSAPLHPVKLCPILSDPYQAIEAKLGLTRACLEVLASAAPRPVLVLTRSPLIERDVDVLSAMPSAFVGMSIPTLDDDARAHFEPRSPSIHERFATLKTLRNKGLQTIAVVQPIFGCDLDAFASALAEVVTSVSLPSASTIPREPLAGGVMGEPPSYAVCRERAFQLERSDRLREALAARGVAVWSGELPPLA
jgi:DNA repair photolyase